MIGALVMPVLEYKSLPFELKELVDVSGGGWEISGYASTFGGEPDEYGDVIAHGAFTASLATRSPKHLFEHGEPIGKTLAIHEDSHGLFGRFSIVDTQIGTDAYKLAKAGVIDSLSIGYRPSEWEYRDDGVRLLKAIDLYEVSSVAIPANKHAVITDVKSALRARRTARTTTCHETSAWRSRKGCGCGDDDEGFTAFAAGSYEALAESLEEAFEAAVIPSGQMGYAEVVATFADHFVAVVILLGPDGMPNPVTIEDPVYWSVPYTVAADGSIALGARTQVSPQATFIPADDGKHAPLRVIYPGHEARRRRLLRLGIPLESVG